MRSRLIFIIVLLLVAALAAGGGLIAYHHTEGYDIRVASRPGDWSDRCTAMDRLFNRNDPERVGPALIGQLNDPDIFVAGKAAELLGWMHFKPAAQPILSALPNVDSDTREKFVTALGEIGDPIAIDPLVKLLGNPSDEFEAKAIAAALAELGPDVMPALLGYLANPKPEVRSAAAGALGSFSRNVTGDAQKQNLKAAVDPLIALLRDPSPEVRRSAASTMGNILDPKFLPALIDAIGTQDDRVRDVQARVLSYYGNDALTALGHAFQSTDTYTHMGAAEALDALADIGSYDSAQKSQPYVSAAAAILDDALAKKDSIAAAGAFTYYIRQGSPAALDLLKSALHDYGSEDMATTLLNCGESSLEGAAKAWAAAHGFTITDSPGKPDIKWGKAAT